jgi:hypothetical protein
VTKARARSSLGLVDYALAALLRLGGDAAFVDVEDIAVEAFRLAPERFRLRRHEYPNVELTRVVLSDANKRGNHLVIYDRRSRKLTVDGALRAVAVANEIDAQRDRPRDDTLRRQDLAEIARMEHHSAFERWRRAGMTAIDAVDLGDLVRCSASTPIDLFVSRLRSNQATAAQFNRDDLARFLGEAAAELPRLIAEES